MAGLIDGERALRFGAVFGPKRPVLPKIRQRLGPLLLLAAVPGLSLVNAGVGLLLPMLLEPVAFGEYALIVLLFQYGLVFDLGLAQLTDRHVPLLLAAQDRGILAGFRQSVLWTRIYIAGVLLGLGAVLAVIEHGRSPSFPAFAGFLSLFAGVAFMLVLGPGSFYRAGSDRRTFGQITIAVMLILAVGRPLGLALGGIGGCFALLGLLYAGVVGWAHAGMPARWDGRPRLGRSLGLIRQGAPLFLTSFVWAFYLTANRWIVSWLGSGEEVGHFAFGSNIVTLIIGAVGSLSQFYYPRIAARFAAEGRYAVSAVVRRDVGLLAVAIAIPTMIGIAAGPALIGLVYPKFVQSVPVVRLLLLAMPSLVVASWLMPLAISIGVRPWFSGLVVYPGALLIQLAVTAAGYRLNGIGGAAAGLVASALPLLLLQLWTLQRAGLLRAGHAGSLLAITAAVTVVASLLVV